LNLIIITLWLHLKPLYIHHLHEANLPFLTSRTPHDRMVTPLGNTLFGWIKLCLFDCLDIYFGLLNFSSYFYYFSMYFYFMFMHRYIEYGLMPSCILFFVNKPIFTLSREYWFALWLSVGVYTCELSNYKLSIYSVMAVTLYPNHSL
jgi:hypothetical protein